MKNRAWYAVVLVVVALVSARNVRAGGFTVKNLTNDTVAIQHIGSWCNIWTFDKQALLTHCDDYKANIYQIEIHPGKSFNIDKAGVWYDVSIIGAQGQNYSFKRADGKNFPTMHIRAHQHLNFDIVKEAPTVEKFTTSLEF